MNFIIIVIKKIVLLFLLILASCSSVVDVRINDSIKLNTKSALAKKNNFIALPNLTNNQNQIINDLFSYKNFTIDPAKQLALLPAMGSATANNNKLIKAMQENFSKIQLKKKYFIELNTGNIYSKKIIELIFEFGLPIQVVWNNSSEKEDFFRKGFLGLKSEKFCNSVYDSSIRSIISNISPSSKSILMFYTNDYKVEAKRLMSFNPNIDSIELNNIDEQELAAEYLGINSSNTRYKKIANLNPNQVLKFEARSRADKKEIILLLSPEKYRSLLPALRYFGGEKFQYINFISSLESVGDSKQLLDYEGSLIPISYFLTNQINLERLQSIEEKMLESMLSDWLLLEILSQAGVESAEINGMTGRLKYRRGSCAERKIPLLLVSSKTISI